MYILFYFIITVISICCITSLQSGIKTNPLKDEEGNFYTAYSIIIRGTVYTLFYSFIVLLFFYSVFLFSDFCNNKSINFIYVILTYLTAFFICILFHFIIKKNIEDKFTLLKDGFKIETRKLSITIPYEELKTWLKTYPPVCYNFRYVMIINNNIIEINYSRMTGAIKFISMLCNNCGVHAPNSYDMLQSLNKNIAHNSESQKTLYTQYKNKFS